MMLEAPINYRVNPLPENNTSGYVKFTLMEGRRKWRGL